MNGTDCDNRVKRVWRACRIIGRLDPQALIPIAEIGDVDGLGNMLFFHRFDPDKLSKRKCFLLFDSPANVNRYFRSAGYRFSEGPVCKMIACGCLSVAPRRGDWFSGEQVPVKQGRGRSIKTAGLLDRTGELA